MQSLIIVIAGIVVVAVILIFGRVFRFFANRPDRASRISATARAVKLPISTSRPPDHQSGS